MKRVETIVIEKVLQQSLFGTNPSLAKEYGTTEVTLSSYYITNGKEFVDFLSYDARKDIFRCYEIKVTMQDFHSSAKLSWYGNYNYLVLSKELYNQQSLADWKKEVPYHVGIIVIDTANLYRETVKNAKSVDITSDIKEMLKNSLLRTLFYQNQKDDWYLRK